ncbi:hypothetical protein QTP86_020664 [Hemibagrus guttatus]|nr:hypothetical protein QTP86_020664 [Hemibagrus guttatus]
MHIFALIGLRPEDLETLSRICEMCPVKKSSEFAARFREKGNVSFKEKDYASAALCYTQPYSETLNKIHQLDVLTYDCAAMHSSNHIVKFADDTTVVGLISKNDDSADMYTTRCNRKANSIVDDPTHPLLPSGKSPYLLQTFHHHPHPKETQDNRINDYRPVALTSVVMKLFERLVLAYLKNITGPLLDPLQFAYRANRSVDDAVNMGLHFILQHLDKSGTYVRLLFVDFSSAFNTIIPILLQTKLTQLSVPSSICQWITSFLTDRHQLVKLGKFMSNSRTTSTGAPRGCVLSPLLFSLYTNDCTSTDPSVKLLKFTDDTTVIGLIQDGDESAYRQEIEQLAAWCSRNNLELNTLKTVEMIMDFRRNTPALPPLTIMNSTVPTVESFRFLGTTISQDLKWDTHINATIKKAQQRLHFLRQLRKFNLPQELLIQFYSAIIESVLCTSITVWFSSATKSDIRRLQRTVRTAERIIGAPLPTLQELHTSRGVCHAEKNTEQLSLCYANRSAALFHLGLYTKCLEDIQRAFDEGYPRRLQSKLVDRKTQCTSLVKKQKCIKASPSKHQTPQTNENKCGNTNVSSAVSVHFTTEKERHLLATENMSAGEVVIEDEAFSFVLIPVNGQYKKSGEANIFTTGPQHCHHCLCENCNTVPCRGCSYAQYCGQRCEKEAWHQYHCWECSVGSELLTLGVFAHLALRVALKAGLKEVQRARESFNLIYEVPKTTFVSSKMSGNGKLCSSGETSESLGLVSDLNVNAINCSKSSDHSSCYHGKSYLGIYSLLPHVGKHDPNLRFLLAFTIAALIQRLPLEAPPCHDQEEGSMCWGSEKSLLGYTALRHMMQLRCNAQAVTAIKVKEDTSLPVQSSKEFRIATAMFPVLSLLNHSCQPNTSISFGVGLSSSGSSNPVYFSGVTVTVRACRDISAGQELLHCYGKGRELADMMERRKVDILCVQETRWKGSKARSIGAGFKLFYYGVDSKRNGVGVVLKEEFVRNVQEVKRVSDRVMSLKLGIEGVMLNVVSGYAPQVIGADFNGQVNTGDEEVMGKFGVKERNLEGQMVVDFAKRMDMAVVNTYFQKREEHRVTYKSGGRRTQVDYILCRRGNLKEISDCKVVVGESVARQHRMVVCRMTLMVCKKKRSKIEKKTKWWKLKKEECCEEFRQKLRQALGGQVVLPDDWETTAEVIRETGRKVMGVPSGRRKEDEETWWRNEEVQDSIQRKRLAKKKWDMDRTEENRQEYKELQHRVKREVSKAKQKAYDELYTRLDTREGEKDLYRLARQRDRDGKDVQQVRVIKDRDGRVLTSEESVQRRWKEYFEELMNEENEREKRVEGVNSVEQKVHKIRKDEVRKALKRMKSGKAVGPDDIPVEVWKCPHCSRMEVEKRQCLLLRQYFFHCKCEACKLELADRSRRLPLTFNGLKCEKCGSLLKMSVDVHECSQLSCDHHILNTELQRRMQILQNHLDQALELMENHQINGALSILQKASNLADSILMKTHPLQGELADAMARAYATMGLWRQAASHLKSSIAAICSKYGKDSVELGRQQFKLAQLHFNGGDGPSALSVIPLARHILSLHCDPLCQELQELQAMEACLCGTM